VGYSGGDAGEGRRGEVRIAEVVGLGEGGGVDGFWRSFFAGDLGVGSQGGDGGGVLKVGMGAGEKVRGVGGGI